MGSGKGGGGGRARIGGGGGAAKVDSASRQDVPNLGTKVTDLPQADQDIISAYTGKFVDGLDHLSGLNAEELNETLRDWRSGVPFDPTNSTHRVAQRYMDDLNDALNRMEPTTGKTLYRVIDDNTISSRPSNSIAGNPRHGDISDLFREGHVAEFADFLSTSKTQNSSYKPYAKQEGTYLKAPIRIKINSSYSGRDIEAVSRFQPEREVLFGTGKKFMVTSKKWNAKRKTWDVTMEEI